MEDIFESGAVMLIVIGVVGFCLGAVLVYFASRAKEAEKQKEILARDMVINRNEDAAQSLTERMQEKELMYQERLKEEQSRTLAEREKRESAEKALSMMQTQKAQVEAKAKADSENFSRQLADFEQTKEVMKKEFENIANKLFEEKERNFAQTNAQSMQGILRPLKEQLGNFQQRVNNVHEASLRENTKLSEEIKKVMDVGLKMSEEATSLSNALKGGSQQRGAWGEAQLERTLEMSGLVQNEHYEKQTSHKDADGRSKQTDYLVKLPDDKSIIIDSKVTLVDYDKAVNAQTEEQYAQAMVDHVNAVKRHIDDLASKDD